MIQMQSISVNYERKFKKQFKKADKKIQKSFIQKRLLFNENPFHPQLNNHQLTGGYKRFRSINITGDWRAIYSEKKVKRRTIITFHLLGTHNQLYK